MDEWPWFSINNVAGRGYHGRASLIGDGRAPMNIASFRWTTAAELRGIPQNEQGGTTKWSS